MSSKKEIRKQMNNELLNFEFEIKKKYDKAIFETFMKLPVVEDAQTICIYHSTNEEANTQAIIYKLLLEGKEICLPRMDGNVMTMRQIETISFPYDKYFGIRQPDKNSTIVLPNQIDLLVLPGLAFDKSKNRLGQGGGFYDKFLDEYKGKTIMLAYSFQEVKDIPIEKHDKKVDNILTEKGMF